MKKKGLRHLAAQLTVALGIMTWTACSDSNQFKLEGTITEAADSMLYLEQMGLDGPVLLDSVKLDEQGHFSFAEEAPTAPEFYRLRIKRQIVNISVDSTETITVTGSLPSLASDYQVKGSDNCERIRQLTLKQMDLIQRIIDAEKAPELNVNQVADSIDQLISAYKQEVIGSYIFKDPKAASSYFALFQALGNVLIFNPKDNAEDIRIFAAVATAWDTFYPGSLRGENLHNIALEGMRNKRIVAARNISNIEGSKITTTGVIDIKLTDNKGVERALTDLKGKVVMLHFNLFGVNTSPQEILHLRELYNRYHSRGLEIYQVALDGDEHFWKQQTAALPWISVRDEAGVRSQRLVMYNVQRVPEFFLIDRDNNLVSRSSQIKDIDKAIEELL